MNLKKKLKAFFTLRRKANDGFTLVELIVVIAILAILGGVAVPAYSGYVERANKQADLTLVSEVEQALTLAYYSGKITESGYVVLTMAAANPRDVDVRDALLVTFGSLDGLKLKHDEWAEGGNFGAYASSVDGSFVTNNIDGLLTDLELCAGNLAWLLHSTGLDNDKGIDIVNGCLGGASISGLVTGYEGDALNETVIANATVFGVASSLTDSSNADAVINGFGGDILRDEIKSSGNSNMLTETAHKYAALEAFVNYVNPDPASGCQCARTVLNNFNDQMTKETSPATIVGNLNTASRGALAAVLGCTNGCEPKAREYYGLGENGEPDPNVVKSPAQKDGEAYVATMQAVNSLSGDYVASLSNSEMFDRENGVIGGDLQTYLALAADIPPDGAYYVVSFRIGETGIIFD